MKYNSHGIAYTYVTVLGRRFKIEIYYKHGYGYYALSSRFHNLIAFNDNEHDVILNIQKLIETKLRIILQDVVRVIEWETKVEKN